MNISEINYYTNESLKISIIASLCRDSLKLLKSVLRIKKIGEIKYHFLKFKEKTPYLQEDFLGLTNLIYDELLIDDVKIISAFENYFKACLLESGFIFHQIKKIKSPLHINSDLSQDIYLKETTYGINELLDKEFWKIYDLSESDKSYIDEIRIRRNTIHFLVSKPSYSPFDILKEAEILKDIIKHKIIVKYKEYCHRVGMSHNTELVDFDFLN